MITKKKFVKSYIRRLEKLLDRRLPQQATTFEYCKEAYNIVEEATRKRYFRAYCNTVTLKPIGGPK